MKIKKYSQFLNESGQYGLGCVMLEVPVSNWEEITSSINEEDLYTEEGKPGIQDNPHVTILYGLHEEVTLDKIKSIFEEFKDGIDISIEGIDLFENESFDVVKFNVIKNEKLKRLNDRLSELPNSNQYPEYVPHITIAYVKKGSGKKYEDPSYRYNVNNLNEICYSVPNGSREYFKI